MNIYAVVLLAEDKVGDTIVRAPIFLYEIHTREVCCRQAVFGGDRRQIALRDRRGRVAARPR
jgi:hypothetical protein